MAPRKIPTFVVTLAVTICFALLWAGIPGCGTKTDPGTPSASSGQTTGQATSAKPSETTKPAATAKPDAKPLVTKASSESSSKNPPIQVDSPGVQVRKMDPEEVRKKLAAEVVEGIPELAAARPAQEKNQKSKEPEVDPKVYEIEPGKEPVIQVNEMTFDFGDVLEGEVVKHSFKVDNIGKGDLYVTRVRSSCGCTVAKEPKDPIPPGGSAGVDVEFSSLRRVGKQEKIVTIFSNDPKTPDLKVTIRGNVKKQFWIEPTRMNLGKLTKAESISDKVFKVRWTDDVDVQITSIEPSHESLHVTQVPVSEENGARGIDLKVTADRVEPLIETTGTVQRVNQFITVKTTHPVFKEEKLYLFGAVEPEIDIRPRVLSYGIVKDKTEPVTKSLTLTATEGFSLDEPSIESSIEFIEFHVKTLKPHQQYQIDATLNPGNAPPNQFRDKIKIVTNSKEIPEMEIFVYGKVGGA